MAGKCGHPACKCVVTGDSSGFCSDYCGEQGLQTRAEHCDCGHAACEPSGSTE